MSIMRRQKRLKLASDAYNALSEAQKNRLSTAVDIGLTIASLYLPEIKAVSSIFKYGIGGARHVYFNSPQPNSSNIAKLEYNFADSESLMPPGSLGSARTWTTKARINAAQLPNEGKIRFAVRFLGVCQNKFRVYTLLDQCSRFFTQLDGAL